jgi:HEAT repeat protein
MSPGLSGLALIVSEIALLFATISIVAIVALVLRRARQEHHVRNTRVSDVIIARELIAYISGGGERAGTSSGDSDKLVAFNNGRLDQRLRTVLRLTQLLRGQEKDKLLEVAQDAGLFADALAQLGSRAPARRVDAMRVLEQLASPLCIDGLLLCMAGDAQPSVRLEAAASLARLNRLPEPIAVIEMLGLRTQALARLHSALFRSLAERDALKLVELIKDDSLTRLHVMLVDALGWSNEFRVLPDIAMLASAIDPEVRCAAVRAARKIGHPSAGDWIMPLLLDTSEQVRVQAVQACGELGLKDAIPILVTLTQTKSWWVRSRAIEALDRLRPGQTLQPARLGVLR